MLKCLLAVLCGIALIGSTGLAQTASPSSVPPPAASNNRNDIAGAVTDSSTGQPLPTIEIVIRQDGRFVAGTFTDAFGQFRVHNLPPGTYMVTARMIGYHAQTLTAALVPGEEVATVDFHLAPAPVEIGQVEVSANAPSIVDVRTGDQTFQDSQFHGAPTTTTSQILQQSITGAARAPTGEVHIRGQHAEYTYYVDGVPVPSGVSGSLNELFDPAIISHIDFKTGAWDAEYGNKNAAVIDVATRIPSGGYHVDLSGFDGSFNTNGQSVNASASGPKLGAFVSGTRSVTDMRREPVVANPLTDEAINFHNHGEDLSGFGKLQYIPRTSDIVGLDADWSRTRFQVPYDSTGGVVQDDRQEDSNGFANLSWRHRFGDLAGGASDAARELFSAVLFRHGKLKYTPGTADEPQFVFFPNPQPFNLTENRSFNTIGVKLDYLFRPRQSLEFKAGALASRTTGHEDFETVDAGGGAGPGSNSDLNGSDIGVYGQAVIAPSDLFEVRPGVRFDTHKAPFARTQNQVSPRIRVSLFPDAGNSMWLYYGRLFLPTNIEDLRAITSVADSGVVAEPTLPERDDFYEAGFVHRFPQGVVGKLTAYQKRSAPGIDDNTVPGSAIVTSVNIATVRITGIEAVLEAKPPGPVSGYLNIALNHAYGHGPITGGFFPVDTPEGYFDLDHDQRLSAVASATYAPPRLFVSVTGIYGSGLTNGADPDASYGTELFDFNKSIKVTANFILNASAGYAFTLANIVVRPQLYVDNVLDRRYILKGAFFSGESVGRPRSIQARLQMSL